MQRELRDERGFAAAFGKRNQIAQLRQRIKIIERFGFCEEAS